jgi:hypothetical protein
MRVDFGESGHNSGKEEFDSLYFAVNVFISNLTVDKHSKKIEDSDTKVLKMARFQCIRKKSLKFLFPTFKNHLSSFIFPTFKNFFDDFFDGKIPPTSQSPLSQSTCLRNSHQIDSRISKPIFSFSFELPLD